MRESILPFVSLPAVSPGRFTSNGESARDGPPTPLAAVVVCRPADAGDGDIPRRAVRLAGSGSHRHHVVGHTRALVFGRRNLAESVVYDRPTAGPGQKLP